MADSILSFADNFNDLINFIINLITSKNNQAVYESEDVVNFYIGQFNLQKPEVTILEEFRSRLPNMKMLDIGVGAGRTTTHFAVLAKEYLGVDYSNKMINACSKKYENYPKKISFLTADARTMKLFENCSFDFVLFSFNGIDYMNHDERIKTLREIRRILKPGGYVCFSTHNLNFQLGKCSIRLSKQPSVLAFRAFQLLQMRLLNKKETWKIIRNSSKIVQHTMVNDGAMNFRLKTYYITPKEQLKQLSELGFSDTKMYGLTDGRVIKNPTTTKDQYTTYLKLPEVAPNSNQSSNSTFKPQQ